MLHVGVHYSVVCSASSCVEVNNVSDYNIKDYPLSNLHTNGRCSTVRNIDISI